jgi:hypothetical protein
MIEKLMDLVIPKSHILPCRKVRVIGKYSPTPNEAIHLGLIFKCPSEYFIDHR